MKVLGKRFHSLDCLDIDYHAFKVDFFQASNEKQEFFNDCFLRNLPICRGISAYSRQFQEYLSKKAKLTLTKSTKRPNQTAKTASRIGLKRLRLPRGKAKLPTGKPLKVRTERTSRMRSQSKSQRPSSCPYSARPAARPSRPKENLSRTHKKT